MHSNRNSIQLSHCSPFAALYGCIDRININCCILVAFAAQVACGKASIIISNVSNNCTFFPTLSSCLIGKLACPASCFRYLFRALTVAFSCFGLLLRTSFFHSLVVLRIIIHLILSASVWSAFILPLFTCSHHLFLPFLSLIVLSPRSNFFLLISFRVNVSEFSSRCSALALFPLYWVSLSCMFRHKIGKLHHAVKFNDVQTIFYLTIKSFHI